MGKLTSGILGNISGKVAGVVGGTWKDRNYLRSYVIPANPNTAAQQAQRSRLARAVEFAKALVGPVFNGFVDPFQKSMSGFNYFIKTNIACFTDPPLLEAIEITSGKLWLPAITAATLNPAADTVTITHPTTLGNNGSATDQIYGAVYHADTHLWDFSAAPVARSEGSVEVPVSGTPNASDLHSWLFAAKVVGTAVVLLSASRYHAVANEE